MRRAFPVWSAVLAAALFSALVLIVPAAFCAATGADAITGTWMVEEKDAYIDIYKVGDRYFGKISWLREGDKKDPEEGRDERYYEKPRVGLIILKDFRFDGGEWKDGRLYDPSDGKSYKGILRLDDKGRLRVRGFVGITLLGRTTVWQRVR